LALRLILRLFSSSATTVTRKLSIVFVCFVATSANSNSRCRLAFISANKFLVTNELVGAVLKKGCNINQKLLMGYHLIISCNHPLIQEGCCCI
jgi:hypothetical protein